jgi:hypothetical protein
MIVFIISTVLHLLVCLHKWSFSLNGRSFIKVETVCFYSLFFLLMPKSAPGTQLLFNKYWVDGWIMIHKHHFDSQEFWILAFLSLACHFSLNFPKSVHL